MSDFLDRVSKMSPKRLALLALELQEKLDERSLAESEPIAVIGMACRFPGGFKTPEEFWSGLQAGVDAITEVPKSRWDVDALYNPDPSAPGSIASRHGGFLDAVDMFEPQVFGIAPREAISMDPQQRLLLEVAWETFERAGYAPDRLNGTDTGVFVGICNGDYYRMLMAGDPADVDMYLATGNAHSVASGRISYVLGLQGPSLSIDTACSSSLVAVAEAFSSVRNGRCRMAITGGVNLILSPDTTIALSRAKMMASDGRCKAFDAAADGFVRSEGCGLVLLKRLRDAVADGDQIHAVLLGAAVNQDGRSSGLTAPNGPSQVALIKEALRSAGIAPTDVDYVETHGTGTSLGDPIEAQALGAALGVGRDASRPLLIGSVKTNLGHLESAAGIAGLMKAILAVRHGVIPPHLHFKNPSPHIPWEGLSVRVPAPSTPWPKSARRIAGVSSFGFSGTNAHVILAEAPSPMAAPPTGDRPFHVLPLSARTDTALRALAEKTVARLADPAAPPFSRVASTATRGRASLGRRAAVVAATAAEAREALTRFLAGEESESIVVGEASTGKRSATETAFFFTGQGSQYVGMGRELYDTSPTFRASVDRCTALFSPLLPQSLLGAMWSEPSSPLLDETLYAQPALFALQVGLLDLWRSWGIEPTAVVGHSAGEFAAAYAAGIFTLEDAVRVVAERARLMHSLPAGGAMASLMASEARVRDALVEGVSVASVNGPESTVVSGARDAVEQVVTRFERAGVEVRRLAVSLAAHSPLVEPILDAFESVVKSASLKSPRIDYVSGLRGERASGDDVATTAYWRRHMRDPVRFGAAVDHLAGRGFGRFVEIGPHPTLLGMARRALPEGSAIFLPSMRSGQSDWRTLGSSIAGLFVHGADIDWLRWEKDFPSPRATLPTYPFERERYWMKAAPAGTVQAARGTHPLLGEPVRSPALRDAAVFESRVGARWPAFLDHHRLFAMGIMPSPAYIEMALAAADSRFGMGAHSVHNLVIREALVLPEDGTRPVQLILRDETEAAATFEIVSRDSTGDAQWTVHATGRVERAAPASAKAMEVVDVVRARCGEEVSGEAFYDRLRELGLEFGPKFQGISKLWRRDGEAVGYMALPEDLHDDARSYRVHPAILDACFHLLGATLPSDGSANTYLLIGLDDFRRYGDFGAGFWNHTVLRPAQGGQEGSLQGDIVLTDDGGRLIGEARGLLLRRVDRETLMRAGRVRRSDWLYDVRWQPLADSAAAAEASSGLSTARVAADVEAEVGPLAKRHGLDAYEGLPPALDRLATTAVCRALRDLGTAPRIGDRIEPDTLAASLGIVSAHRRLFARMLEMLGEDGLLKQAGVAWEVVREIPSADAVEGLGASLAAQFPQGASEIYLTARCGARLADVLRGQCDPLGLLFPGGSLQALESIYQLSPPARVFNGLVRATVERLLQGSVTQGRVRALEIGAGTGATSAAILDLFPPGRSEYVFTDLSPAFLSQAAAKFAAYPFVRREILDIEKDPATQGFSGRTFDLVIAANVLHATSELRKTLENVRGLLAPGGVLVLLEGTKALRWVDVTFGLTEGWWRFADPDLRPGYPLLQAGSWRGVLSQMGFSAVEAIPAKGTGTLGMQSVIVAQAPIDVPEKRPETRWLIFADTEGVGDALAAAARRRGQEAAVVTRGKAFAKSATDRFVVAAQQPEDFDRVFMEEAGTDGALRVVHLWSLDARPASVSDAHTVGVDVRALTGSAARVIQALAKSGRKSASAWLVTRGAQPAVAGDVLDGVAQSAVWGLGRVAALEHPEVWGGLVDLGSGSVDVERLLSVIESGGVEDQLALRGDKTFAPRLVRHGGLRGSRPRFKADGSYLITGGFGGLGLKLAAWLVDQGVTHVALLGRRGLGERATWASLAMEDPARAAIGAIEAMEAKGATLTLVAADLLDARAMDELFARFGTALPPLRGVFHAAATLGGVPLRDLDDARLAQMLGPKVEGTWLLAERSRSQPLEHFVLFSSTTALWGSKDLAHYAAANAFLDAFAYFARATGLPVTSVNWGTWDVMRVASAGEQRSVEQFGLQQMASAQALDLLGEALGASVPEVVVAAVDWSALKPAYEAKRARPFLSLVGTETRPTARPRAAQRPNLLAQFEAARPQARRDVVLAFVRGEAARVLGLDGDKPLDVQQGLFEMGMDSLMSVELKSRLEAAVGRGLPSTLTFNYPSVSALADYLLREALVTPAAAKPAAAAAAPPRAAEPTSDKSRESLSEDQLAALLAKKLQGKAKR